MTPSPYHIHHLQSREKATGLRVDIKLVAGFRKVWFALYMMLITLRQITVMNFRKFEIKEHRRMLGSVGSINI